ncbi:MAG TPA: phosphotransferase [Candidatus Limnocylindria bacterium]|nr:phosphotransferase [Candidatus Limnocylindria bacterium]
MQGLTVWTDARWRASFAGWIDDALREAGERRVSDPDEVHLRPWSVVWRLRTDAGIRFAKAGATCQAHEPALLAHLATLDASVVPELVARDDDRGWSITVDGGRRARDLEDRDAVLAILEAALPRFAALQRAASTAVARMLTMDVPDRRPAAVLPALAALLDDPASLAGDDEALTAAERGELISLLPRLSDALAELAAGPIPPSIEHGDLHDANVYVDHGGRVFDWGDATVAHPFASLLIVDVALENRFGLAGDAPEVRRLHRAYLEPWTALAPMADLERLAREAMRLGGASKALGWVSMLTLMPPGEVAEWRDAPSIWLRDLLEALRAGAAGPSA